MKSFFEHLTLKNVSLSLQHALAMIGGTILIPILMGLPPAVGLFTAGVSTLIYAFCTKKIVPIFLGSSAAYLATFMTIKAGASINVAVGSFIGAGIMYMILGLIVTMVGYKKIMKLFPPLVSGAIVCVIGLTLIPLSLSLCKTNYTLGLIAAILVILFSCSNIKILKGFPILLAIVITYIVAIFMGVVDLTAIAKAPWISLPAFVKPSYSFNAIGLMMITALISLLEHVGELTTNGIVVGNNHFENPGLHRSLFGNGLGLLFAGIIGGTPTTTYGENTSVIAITGNKEAFLIRGAAIIAIILSIFGKFSAFLASIPLPIIGGVSFLLFGMLLMAGITVIRESDSNLMEFKNSVVVFLPIFIGVASILPDNPLKIIIGNVTLSGLNLAAIVGIALNLIINGFKNK